MAFKEYCNKHGFFKSWKNWINKAINAHIETIINPTLLPANQPTMPTSQPTMSASQPTMSASQPTMSASQPCLPASQPIMPSAFSTFAKQLVRNIHECVAFMESPKNRTPKNKKLFSKLLVVNKALLIAKIKPCQLTLLNHLTFQQKCKSIVRNTILYVKKKIQQKMEALDRYLMTNQLDEFINDDKVLVYANLLQQLQPNSKFAGVCKFASMDATNNHNVWMFECLNVWMLVCWNVEMFECLNVWMFECLNVWMLACWNVEMLKCWNVWMFVNTLYYSTDKTSLLPLLFLELGIKVILVFDIIFI